MDNSTLHSTMRANRLLQENKQLREDIHELELARTRMANRLLEMERELEQERSARGRLQDQLDSLTRRTSQPTRAVPTRTTRGRTQTSSPPRQQQTSGDTFEQDRLLAERLQREFEEEDARNFIVNDPLVESGLDFRRLAERSLRPRLFDNILNSAYLGDELYGYQEDPLENASYEQLSQLQDVKVGVKPEILVSLPVKRLTTQDNGDKQCSVCMEGYEKGQNVTTLPCWDRFHTDCINVWLEENHICPICRLDINEVELNV
ncbi:RING finger domain--containing protein [Acrasis kona]|uniref:RING finger domain--containing protein n=1 Tax=Acrasis kona TaxID=1008807 RepID=A0AAW2YLH1_9EUKA